MRPHAAHRLNPGLAGRPEEAVGPFATQTIPATVHEAPYILDGLLMNETGRRFLAHVSPLGWEHINLTGEYRWPRTASTGRVKSLA